MVVSRAAALFFLFCGLLAATFGCGRDPASDTTAAELPQGLLLAGNTDALSQVLLSLEGLRGTPLARHAGRLRERLAGCERFLAHAPGAEPSALLEGVRCVPLEQQPAAVRELLGDGDLAFALPVGESSRLVGNAQIDADGSVRLEGAIDPPPTEGAAGFLVPAAEPPGRAVLSAQDALVQGRLRPQSGLDIARWVASGSQADALFKLKSQLFAGAVLAGNLEFATYLPRPGRVMPGAVLAVDVKHRAGALVGMQQFISDLEATWPIHHQSVRIAEHDGACFFDLRILPDFAPCYVATENALVVGWNPDSIEQALPVAGVLPVDGAPSEEGIPSEDGAPSDERIPSKAQTLASSLGDGLAEKSGLVVHFDRISLADERLRAALAPDAAPVDFDYAWERLVVESHRDGELVRIRLELRAGEAS